jgi:hypothetical protein
MTDCRVCAGRHDPDVHKATLAVHRWLRDQLALALAPARAKQPAGPERPAAPGSGLPGVTHMKHRHTPKGAAVRVTFR